MSDQRLRPVYRLVAASMVAGLAARAALAQFVDNPVNTQTPLLDQLLDPSSIGGGAGFEPGVTVATRRRPEYDSSGVTFGDLTIRPQVTESAGFDSNVLGTGTPRGSPVVETSISLSAEEDWSGTDTVNASASVDDNRYSGAPRQDFTDWSATIGGSHEFGRDIGSVRYTHSHMELGPLSLDVPQLDKPVPYDVDLLQLRDRVNLSGMFLIPELDVSDYRYSDGTVAGQPYVLRDLDRVVVAPSLTVGYEVAPHRDLIAVLRDANATYSNQSIAPPSRNYNDVALLGGFDYDVTAAVRVRALVGYESREFQSAGYKTIAAPVVEATAIWTPRAATTVTGTVARRIQDSTDNTTAAFTETYGQLRVDEEYLPNVLLRASAGLYYTEYGSGGGSQKLYSAGLGVTYLFNRNMQAVATYDISARQSSGMQDNSLGISDQSFGPDYTDHRVMLELRLRL